MTKWTPDVQKTIAEIDMLRAHEMGPEMIGFRIGWKWATERVLKKHSDIMLEMAQLHEQEKENMLAAWTAHHNIAMMHARNAAALKPFMMALLVFLGMMAGLFFGWSVS